MADFFAFPVSQMCEDSKTVTYLTPFLQLAELWALFGILADFGQFRLFLANFFVTILVRTVGFIDWRRFSEVLVVYHGLIKHYIKEIDHLSGGTLRH